MATWGTSFPSPKMPNLALPVNTSFRPKRLDSRPIQARRKSFKTAARKCSNDNFSSDKTGLEMGFSIKQNYRKIAYPKRLLIKPQFGCILSMNFDVYVLNLVFKQVIMKRIFTLLGALVLLGTAFGQTTPSAELLQFKEAHFDFGKIPQGKPVYHSFVVTNTGTEPLKIDNVQTSCGCTTPEWSKEPIAPGASATIKVGFNAAAGGIFEKYITVLYNGNQTKQVVIKGEVWKSPEGSAPVNASVQLLKTKNQ